MVEAFGAQRGAERLDQMIILTVTILAECREGAIGQRDRVRLHCLSKRTEISARAAKFVADDPVAVIAARMHGIGHIHEQPHQFQRVGRVDLRHLIDDRTTLRFEIGGEISYLAPVDEGARAGDLDEPLAHLRCHGLRRLLGGELQPETTMRRRIVLGDVHK